MNFIEVLKLANGNPVSRRAWSKDIYLKESVDKSLAWNTGTTYGMYVDDILSDDWYVVAPKSKIEEAIKLEVNEYCRWTSISTDGECSKHLSLNMHHVANAAIDEVIDTMEADFGGRLNKQSREKLESLKLGE